MKVKVVGQSVQKRFTDFLSDKPLWVSWIVYSLLSAILFGIFYTAMYFMALQWWIPVITIIVVGMIWGTLNYKGEKKILET